MQIMRVVENNVKQKQSFGMAVNKIDLYAATSAERKLVMDNFSKISKKAEDIGLEIKLEKDDFCRYFTIKAYNPNLSSAKDANCVYGSNPRTVFNLGSPLANIEQALMSNINRAKEAYLKHNK